MKSQFELLPFGDPLEAFNYNNQLFGNTKTSSVFGNPIASNLGINIPNLSTGSILGNNTNNFGFVTTGTGGVKPYMIVATGTVIDSNGNPVEGVNLYTTDPLIKVKGTVTDKNGKFTMSVKSTDTITVSHVSFETQTFTGANLPTYIELFGGNSLDEVIVNAAPKPKKTNKVLIAGGIGLGLLGLAFMLKSNSSEGMNAPKPKPVKKTVKKVTL